MPRAKRICSRTGCPTTTTGSLCPSHKAEAERARGNSNQRGYGTKHQALRREWTPKVNAGRVLCAKCNKPIHPGTPWDLGHTDDRTAYTGPEHARCNRSAGGQAAHQ